MNVSVVIPAYNAERYIVKAIDSILGQTYKVKEIIIVDDGSIDSTCAIIEQYGLDTITLIKQSNAGVSVARNVGIHHTKGDWVLFLDADDECHSQLIENYNHDIVSSPVDMLYSDAIQIDENSNVIPGLFTGKTLQGKQGFVNMLMRNPIISPSGCLIKKTTLEKLSGFDCHMNYAEDVDLYLRILYNGGNIVHIPKTLTYIRRHTLNTTSNISLAKQGEKPLLQKYSLNTIKEAIFSGTKKESAKQLDYVNFLIRYEQWEEAEIYVKHMIVHEDDEHYRSYLFTTMLIALHHKNYKHVKQYALHLLQLDANHGASINNLGCVYAIEKQFELAEKQFNKALALFPGYMDATYNLTHLGKERVEYKFTKRELRTSLLRYS